MLIAPPPTGRFALLCLPAAVCVLFLFLQRRASKCLEIVRMCLLVVVEMHHNKLLEVRQEARAAHVLAGTWEGVPGCRICRSLSEGGESEDVLKRSHWGSVRDC